MPTVKQRERRPLPMELVRDGYEADKCDDKTWQSRGDLARILAPFFEADGVMFDATKQAQFGLPGAKKVFKGFVYFDRKGRFDDGWRIWTSLVQTARKPTKWPEGVGKQPSSVRIVKTLYSTYVVFLKEPDPK